MKWIVLQYTDDGVIELRRAPRNSTSIALGEVSQWRWRNGSLYDAKIIFIGGKLCQILDQSKIFMSLLSFAHACKN